MRLIGINELASKLKLNRGDLKRWAIDGKIPYVRGKLGRMLFSVTAVSSAIEREMQNGAGSLLTHQTGGDGSRSAEVDETSTD